MLSDIEIAQQARMQRITVLARERLGIAEEHLEPYGHFKAKLSLPYLDSLKDRPDGKLILVTAISPTPAGEGKTTTTVGLGDALNHIGKKTVIALREPSLGPVFGMKGGATGGGRAQVLPMEEINLHFTGDFHAIALANNLLAAVIDNHIHHGNALDSNVRVSAPACWRYRNATDRHRPLRQVTIKALSCKAFVPPSRPGRRLWQTVDHHVHHGLHHVHALLHQGLALGHVGRRALGARHFAHTAHAARA